MGKKKNRYSFASRLTRWILLVVVLDMAAVGYYVGSFMVESGIEDMDGLLRTELRSTNQFIRRALSDVYTATFNIAPYIEDHLNQPDQIFDIMERVVRLNSRILCCGVSFVPDYYPQKGRLFVPYAFRNGEGKVEIRDVGNTNHDYSQEAWFQQVLQCDSGYWSKPFLGGSDSTVPLISYLMPIHNKQGQVVAVLGADISLEWLMKKMQEQDDKNNDRLILWDENDRRYTSYSFIIHRDGTYIAHPDKSRILCRNFFDYAKATADTLDDRLGYDMLNGKKGVCQSTLDGIESKVFYQSLDHTDWTIAIVVPKSTILLPGYVMGVVCVFFFSIGLIVIYFVCRIMIKRATRPLVHLAASADEVAKGNFQASLPIIRHHDEIRLLRDSFETMQHSLVSYVDELTKTTAQKASIERELDIANKIQMEMLPKVFPPYPDRSDIDIYGELTPAKAVGGDLFDFYIRDGHLFFCIGDVSGKGIPASLVMAVTRSLFRNISAHVSRPNRIVEALNNALNNGNDSNMFVTFFIGVLDLATGHLDYCNAGHDAPLLCGRQGLGLLPCEPNLPVGVMPGWQFKAQEAMIDPHTTIFLYTDGLTEAENIDHVLFGEERMLAEFTPLRAADTYQPLQIIRHMTKAVHDFVGEAEQSDDLTMLAIQYRPV